MSLSFTTVMSPVRIAIVLAACLAGGCGSSESGGGGDPAGPSGQAVSCDNDSRAMTYSANLKQMGKSGVFQVVLVQSDPAPPARGTNTWTIKVLDAHGTAVDNPTLTVKPFMPDHGHGTSVKPVVTPGPDGTFTISPLYLFMPGLWEVTFSIQSGMSTDSVVFSFCIAG